MKDFIYIKENSIDDKVCDDIIKLFEKYPEHQFEGYIGHSSNQTIITNINKTIKDTTDMNILKLIHIAEWNEISNILIDSLEKNINIYMSLMKEKFSIDLNAQFGKKSFYSLLIHKYKKKEGKFLYHNDSFCDKKYGKYRILNYLWYLNDVDEGGETEFFGFYKIKPKKGNLVFFPSDWLFPHSGKVPISNDKYVVSGWIYVDL